MQLALSLRTAAYILLVVDLGPRLSECALIKMLQVDDDGKTMDITIDARHSKGRKNGREKVSPEAADAIRKYLKSGRPILLNGSHDNEKRALWISEDGLDAEAQCMAAALRRRTLGVVPGGAAANAIRRSKLSKEGQTLPEMAQQARQAYGSKTAAMVYTVRDRATAVREGQSLSTLSLDDV
jgi:hypothetical protein